MLHESQQDNIYQFSPPKPMQDYSKDSIKKMAVLFTDIVGSSKYFKSHGDIAGRKMLKLHQDIASPVITGFGGAIVKMLGDSLMAYFLNPDDAFKAAIQIQQKFQNFNKNKLNKDQIHIRLCVHYGDGIIDEGDIFGDVVNMAAKFLPFASGDEIIISQELRNNIKDSPHINFSYFENPSTDNVLKDLRLLKVIWDKEIELSPTMKTLIHIKPVWRLGKKGLESIWNRLITNRGRFWSNKTVEKEQINNDRSISLIVRKSTEAIRIANGIISFLKTNMGQDAALYVPVQIAIDSGAFLRAGVVSLENLNINWKEVRPGEIYASEIMCNCLKENRETNIVINDSNKISGSFYKISGNNAGQQRDYVFRYQNALIQGEYSPCFYCGNRSHPTSKCPSKMITELTNYIEKLGHMTLDNINNLFFHYLNDTQIGNIEFKSKTSPAYLAHNAFYELKSVFQLRLFRTIWNIKEENWNKIKENKDEKDTGGLLWIALDCIRVSNHEQAESIIEDEMEKRNQDYKLFCLMGLLFIEKNNFRQAKTAFKKALDLAQKTPEKIFVLFLMFRIFTLSDDTSKAKEMIRKILNLNPYCNEAIYQDIIFKFKYGNRSLALEHLVKLVKKNKDYYVIALIDPDLSSYNKKITTKLEQLYIEAKRQADEIMPYAKNEMVSLEKLVGENSDEIIEARALMSKMETLYKSESYFGYLDMVHYGGSILKLGQRIVKSRERQLFKIEKDLKYRIQRCVSFLELIPYRSLNNPVSNRIRMIQARIEGLRDKLKLEGVKEFQKTIGKLENISKELYEIEEKIRKLDAIAQFYTFVIRFLKKNLIFQSANLAISLILIPLLIHYLTFIFPNMDLSTLGIWHFQKVLIVLGGITGLVLSSLASQNPSK